MGLVRSIAVSYKPEIVPAGIFFLQANVLVNYALEKGANLAEMLAGVGLDEWKFQRGNEYLCAQQYSRLVRNFVNRFSHAGLGLEFGRRQSITTRGTLGLGMLSMATLGDVYRFGIKYQEVLDIHQTTSIENNGDRTRIIFRYDDTVMDNPHLFRFLVENNLANYVNTGRYLLQTHFEPLEVGLPYPMPVSMDAYFPLLGRNLQFGSNECELVFERKRLESPLPTANPIVANACFDVCDDLLRSFRKNQPLTYRINSFLSQRHGAYPTLQEFSSILNLDERTIRRRLALERTSYKLLLNQARTRHASKLLSSPGNSVEAVAMAIGFNNASNFRRAFRTWTGVNPGEFREQPHEQAQRVSA